MPRGSYLSELEKGNILAFQNEGLSLRETARRINRSHKVVSNYLRNPAQYGTNKKGGPKKKVSPRTARRITATANNSLKSCKRIGHECGANVSRWTIRRILNKNEHIVRQKLKKSPRLLPRHKTARLEFAHQNMNRNWENVT
jgi:transposase